MPNRWIEPRAPIPRRTSPVGFDRIPHGFASDSLDLLALNFFRRRDGLSRDGLVHANFSLLIRSNVNKKVST